MKVERDYTMLADAYMKRADYADEVISRIIEISGANDRDYVCDMGS